MENAELRLNRAQKLLEEIKDLISYNNPFDYLVETNTSTGERATFSRANKALLDQLKIISGDVIHNLRAAIDNAYWDIVSKYVDEKDKRNVQFPFCGKEERLPAELKKRHADRVGDSFLAAITDIKPYKSNGNKIFALIHELDITDKHKFPTPIGDFTKISTDSLRRQLYDFPENIGEMSFGGCKRDIVWKTAPSLLKLMDLGKIIPPTTCKFEKQLDLPVQAVFSINDFTYRGEVCEMLTAMLETSKGIVFRLYAASNSA